MSDVKCARMLFRAAERDITSLSFMRDSSEYRPSVVACRDQGDNPDADPINSCDALALLATLREHVGRALEEAEAG